MTDELENDDVFNDSTPEIIEEETPDIEVSEEEGESEADDEETQETEDEAEPPAAEASDEHEGKTHVPVKAVLEERRKRQELESKTQELEAKVKAYEAGGLVKTNSELTPEIQQEITKIRRETSVNLVKTMKEDYDEKEKLFVELTKTNPALINEMDASGNPALFAYNTATEHLELQELKSLKNSPEWKEFIEAKKSGKLDSPQLKRNKSALSVPNLNKMASVKPKDNDSNDDVFAGSAF